MGDDGPVVAMAVVRRLDDGGYKDKGSFECAICGARSHAHVGPNWPYHHTSRKHPGLRCKLERVHKRKVKTQEEKRERNRAKQRRYLQRQKEAAAAAAAAASPEGPDFPLIISRHRGSSCMSRRSPGKGLRLVAVGGDDDAKESFHVAISFVALNASLLRAWVTGEARSSAGLCNRFQDLHVSIPDLGVRKQGNSAGACVALSLACLLGGCRLVKRDVAITGVVDLRGRILGVGDIREKLERVIEDEIDMLVIPEVTYKHKRTQEEMAAWPEELRRRADELMVMADTFVDLLATTIPGVRERGTEGLAEQLDGPQVGVGVVTGLVDDGVGLMEFQACSVGPGDRDLILTGGMSALTRECVGHVVGLIEDTLPQIGACMGVPAAKRLYLRRPHHNLHVHSCRWTPVEVAYQQGAIYVALVSLVLKRRCRPDTAIFGAVSHSGYFTSAGEFTARAFRFCHFMGMRRVVLAEGTRISDEAKEAAGVLQEDGKPLVTWFIRDTVLKALPLMFCDAADGSGVEQSDG